MSIKTYNGLLYAKYFLIVIYIVLFINYYAEFRNYFYKHLYVMRKKYYLSEMNNLHYKTIF